MVTIRRGFHFEAAHHLANHDGKCRNVHGHSYRFVVEVAGEPNPADGQSDEGMVLDFARLTEAWARLEPTLDHRDLNEVLGPVIGPTTAENIAVWLLGWFREELPEAHITGVTLYETATSSATAR